MNSPTALRAHFAEALIHELEDARDTIAHCLRQLNDEQIWFRPATEMNAIGNLVLHLRGNVSQWIVAHCGGNEDQRDRPSEFAERGPVPGSQLGGQLAETVQQAVDVIRSLDDEQWMAAHRIQGFETTGAGAVIHSIAHFRGHTQEIVHLTRLQLGDQYEMIFVP